MSEAQRPSYRLEFSDWKLDQALSAEVFTFKRAAEATRIPFRSAEAFRAARRGTPPGR